MKVHDLPNIANSLIIYLDLEIQDIFQNEDLFAWQGNISVMLMIHFIGCWVSVIRGYVPISHHLFLREYLKIYQLNLCKNNFSPLFKRVFVNVNMISIFLSIICLLDCQTYIII